MIVDSKKDYLELMAEGINACYILANDNQFSLLEQSLEKYYSQIINDEHYLFSLSTHNITTLYNWWAVFIQSLAKDTIPHPLFYKLIKT